MVFLIIRIGVLASAFANWCSNTNARANPDRISQVLLTGTNKGRHTLSTRDLMNLDVLTEVSPSFVPSEHSSSASLAPVVASPLSPASSSSPTLHPSFIMPTSPGEVTSCFCNDDNECLENPPPVGLASNTFQFCVESTDENRFRLARRYQFESINVTQGPKYSLSVILAPTNVRQSEVIRYFQTQSSDAMGNAVSRVRFGLDDSYASRMMRSLRAFRYRYLTIHVEVRNDYNVSETVLFNMTVPSERFHLWPFLEGEGWTAANSYTVWLTRGVTLFVLIGLVFCCCFCWNRRRRRYNNLRSLKEEEDPEKQVDTQVLGDTFEVMEEQAELDIIVQKILDAMDEQGTLDDVGEFQVKQAVETLGLDITLGSLHVSYSNGEVNGNTEDEREHGEDPISS